MSSYSRDENFVPILNNIPPGAISGSTDAFGRQRVSDPETIFDSKQLHDNSPLLFDDQQVSGGGTTSVHSSNTASTVMGVADSTAGKRVRQTFMWFNYQPGKSQLIFVTGTLQKSGGGDGITRAFGYFDESNGLFVRDNEGVIQLVKRTNTSGTPVDIPVNQKDWNIDKMDGTGASGITLDFTKSQILIVDFEWLGVGRVRMGFVVNGGIFYTHEFNHANNLAGVYMSTPNLPIRYEIANDGTGDASTLEHICSSVISEGGQQSNGILRHIDSGVTGQLTAGTAYALLGGRLKSTHLDVSIIVENISCIVANTSGGKAHWELRIGATVAGTFTYEDQANSAVQVAKGGASNTVTGGIEIDGGFFTDSSSTSFTVPNALRLGSTIDGTPQTWQLVVIPVSNNITVNSSVTWRELL